MGKSEKPHEIPPAYYLSFCVPEKWSALLPKTLEQNFTRELGIAQSPLPWKELGMTMFRNLLGTGGKMRTCIISGDPVAGRTIE